MRKHGFEYAVKVIADRAKEISDEKVYYILRARKLKYVTETTMQTMKMCFAVSELGLRITVDLLHELTARESEGLRTSLHALGDKRCLVLVRGEGGGTLSWLIDPDLQKLLSGRENK